MFGLDELLNMGGYTQEYVIYSGYGSVRVPSGSKIQLKGSGGF